MIPEGKLLWSWQASGTPPAHDLFAGVDPRFEWNPFEDQQGLCTFKATSALTLVAPYDMSHAMACVSYIPELHAELVGEWRSARLTDFKCDWRLRRPLLQALEGMGIDGWLHPIENDVFTMEVCLTSAASKVVDARVVASPGTCATRAYTPTPRLLDEWRRLHAEQLEYEPWCWTPFQHVYMRQ